MLMRIFLVFLSQYSFATACWGVNEDDELMNDPRYKDLLNGWHPPPGSMKSNKQWLEFYKNIELESGNQLQKEDIAAGMKPEGHDIANWPSDWRGMGPGYEGVKVPPPWAYRPINFGRPSACMLPPDIGTCDNGRPLYRFGYNPILDECDTFKYSGCGGNQNNWVTKEACEQYCINPSAGCDIDSHLPIDLTIMS